MLGLWLVIVQQRAKDLEHNRGLQRQAYAVALSFALPGMMGVLALVDTADAKYWRTSFAVVALAGVVILAAGWFGTGGRSLAETEPQPPHPPRAPGPAGPLP